MPYVNVEDLVTFLNSENPQDVILGIELYKNFKEEMDDQGISRYYASKGYVMQLLMNEHVNPRASWKQGVSGFKMVMTKKIKNQEFEIEL